MAFVLASKDTFIWHLPSLAESLSGFVGTHLIYWNLNIEFLVTSLIVVLMPGTGSIYTISTGLFLGWRSSIVAATGCTLGIIPHLLASSLGLSALLLMSSLVFQFIKYLGAAYLLYLAWSMWRETGSLKISQTDLRSRSMIKIAVRGILINILNPKLSIFFLAFLPLFIKPESDSPILDFLWLSAVFMLMTLVIFILYGLFAHAVSSYLLQSKKSSIWLQKSFAVIFAGLGIKLALT